MAARGDGFGVALLLLVVAAPTPPGAAQPCTGKLNGQGLIATPNFYTNSYPWGKMRVSGGRARCQWTLTPAASKRGNLHFNVFDLAPGASLSVYQGTNAGDSVSPLTRYTGKGPTGGVVQFAGAVTLVFTEADLSFNRGFQLGFYSTAVPLTRSLTDAPSPECGGTLVGAGAVTSPGYPGIYPLNAKCSWTLLACETGAQLTVHFTAMDIEQKFDSVMLISGQTQYGPFSGGTLPKDITALAPITVAFSSDNVMSNNMGFSLQFSTVSAAVAPVDPLANPGACAALCPANVTDDRDSFCYAHDDPHMRRFDGQPYEFQKAGLYYLYKHKTAPVAVQAAFQPCITWPTAFCVCAVAVRYCDEVFVVDKCFTKTPVGGQSNKLYKAGSGSAMSVQPRPTGGWTVRLPTGLRVEIDNAKEWIGNVDLHDSLGNRGASDGLCSSSYRCGTSPTQFQSSYDSWRVLPEESLFTIWKQPLPCKIKSCVNDRCAALPQFAIPFGVLSLSDPNISPDQYSDSSNFLYGTSGANGARGANGDVAPKFVAPWTAQSALTFCTNSLQFAPGITKCQQLLGSPVNLADDIANCVRDIQITGTTVFLTTAQQASKTTCLQQLSNARINPAPALALMCPNDCSQKGICNNGVCSCVTGRYGPDCSVNITVPPVLTNTSAAVNCPTNATALGVCLLQYIYGQTFYALKSGTPTCNITSRADISGTTTPFKVTVVPAVYLSATVVVCQLPPGRPGEHVSYTISISNDGTSYSNNVKAQRTFFLACGQHFTAFGGLLSPNYPSNYNNNASCTWNLIASAGSSVRLAFNAFNIENSFDVMRCYDAGQLIDTFTGDLGTSLAPKYYGASLTCVFTSDASIVASGFNISFTSVLPAARCGGSIVGNGTIYSPGYPSIGYPHDVYCLWTLTAAAGKSLKLHFSDLALELNHDYLTIYTGGSLFSKLTGSTLPADFTLPSTAYLILRSDASVTARGFSILITSASVSSLSSPNFSAYVREV